MRALSLFSSLVLATAVVAAPIPNEQNTNNASIMSQACADVSRSLRGAIPAVQNLSKAPHGVDLTNMEREIERTAKDVSDTLQRGAMSIRRGSDVTFADMQSLQPAFSEMLTLSKRSTQAWIDAKRVVVNTQGGREAVLRILNDHFAYTKMFNDAVKSKVPAGFSYPTGLVGEITVHEIQNAITTYKLL